MRYFVGECVLGVWDCGVKFFIAASKRFNVLDNASRYLSTGQNIARICPLSSLLKSRACDLFLIFP